jgi:hypothetical protein
VVLDRLRGMPAPNAAFPLRCSELMRRAQSSASVLNLMSAVRGKLERRRRARVGGLGRVRLGISH